MPEPMGWQLLEALAAVLENMVGTRPWGGSYPRQPIVDHQYRTPRTTEDFLRLRVLEASGSTTRITNINPVNNITHHFRVKIEATIIGNDEQSPQAWVQRVRDDLLTTVLANLTLGGLTSGFEEEITWDSSEAETEFAQQVTLTAIVGYRFRESKAVA